MIPANLKKEFKAIDDEAMLGIDGEIEYEQPCVRDDITECDCPRCQADEARWEEWQGWEAR